VLPRAPCAVALLFCTYGAAACSREARRFCALVERRQSLVVARYRRASVLLPPCPRGACRAPLPARAPGTMPSHARTPCRFTFRIRHSATIAARCAIPVCQAPRQRAACRMQVMMPAGAMRMVVARRARRFDIRARTPAVSRRQRCMVRGVCRSARESTARALQCMSRVESVR